jgi:hypothetical protein
MKNKIWLLGIGVSIVCLLCMQKPRMGIALTRLYVLENKYGRHLIDKDANKKVATIEKGDTFQIFLCNQDPETDFFTYYKIKTKNSVKGFLFEKDSFNVINEP